MSSKRSVPEPAVMALDREAWMRQLDLSTFVNAYYQYRDLQHFERCQHVLMVGPGQGLGTAVLRWRGYNVTTFDIDKTFAPDVLGSVHDMHVFRDRQFDCAIASHVLEHLPVTYLDQSLAELSRVAGHALIYLPVAGRHFQARLQPGFKGIDLSLVLDLFNYVHKPTGMQARYCQQNHYWEVGMRGFRIRDIKARLSRNFEVLNVYRNRDWIPSVNFLLRSR